MAAQERDGVEAAIQLGGSRLRNRIVFSATANNLGENFAISDRQVAFYEERSRGGVGAVITEGLSVHSSSVPLPTYPMVFDEAMVEGFARIASAVHKHGAVAIGQLHHAGGRGYVPSGARCAWSQAEFRDFMSGTVPHAMDGAEIRQVIAGFVASAANLRRAGFDGVEVHAAHDFLVAQFLSPARNRRTDEWGGTLRGRTKFLTEVIAGIRDAVDDDFVVGIRLTGDDFLDGGVDQNEARAIAERVSADVRVDFIAVSQGSFGPAFDRHCPDMRFADAPFVGLAGAVRASDAKVRIMAVGKIPDLATAERVLREGAADMVAMCRPLLADAHLVAKSLRGQRPRPCIFCNRCWHELHQGRAVGCFYAPPPGTLAPEIAPARPSGRTVRVIGAGLAGLEFARVVAQAGAPVEVYERRDAPGGRLLAESLIEGREATRAAGQWLADEVLRLGGVIHTGIVVDESMIDSWPRDDIVVQATGAVPRFDEVAGAPVQMSLEAAVHGDVAGAVVIIDQADDEPVYAFAESLARRGQQVAIVTRQEFVGRKLAFVSRMGSLRRMDELGVTIHPSSEPVRVEDGHLVVRHAFSAREMTIGACRTLVFAGPYGTTPPIETGGRQSILIGEALSPRDPGTIAQEANAAARAVVGWLGSHTESHQSLGEAVLG